jgi:branched-chain amino acid transport system ATP-binding protein
MAELLCLDHVSAGYGEAVVLEDISLSIAEEDSLALLGRNGMGKTTLLITLMGLTRLHRGAIRLRGADIGALPTHQRVHSGLGWVPQERSMFASLTVEEHLTAVARPGHWNVARVYRIFPRLEERRRNLGSQSRAASSRCSPSPARSWSIRACCCSTSRWRAWPRS